MDDPTPMDRGWGALFDAAPLPLLIHSGGQIRYSNPAAARLLGAAAPAEIDGSPLDAFVRPDGAIARLDGSIVDVDTARWPVAEDGGAEAVALSARTAPAETDERFRRLFEEAPIAYHEIDAQGIVVRVNRAECDLLGFKREELVGKPIWSLVAPEQRELSRQRVWAKLT